MTALAGSMAKASVGSAPGAAGSEDQGVAGVLAAEGAGEDDAGGKFGFEVLEAVDGEVDAAVGECFVDLLGEQAFAADLGEGAILHSVTGRADDVFLEHVQVVEARRQHRAKFREQAEEDAGLHPGEWRAAGPNPERQAAAGVCLTAWHAHLGQGGGLGVRHRIALWDRRFEEKTRHARHPCPDGAGPRAGILL